MSYDLSLHKIELSQQQKGLHTKTLKFAIGLEERSVKVYRKKLRNFDLMAKIHPKLRFRVIPKTRFWGTFQNSSFIFFVSLTQHIFRLPEF